MSRTGDDSIFADIRWQITPLFWPHILYRCRLYCNSDSGALYWTITSREGGGEGKTWLKRTTRVICTSCRRRVVRLSRTSAVSSSRAIILSSLDLLLYQDSLFHWRLIWAWSSTAPLYYWYPTICNSQAVLWIIRPGLKYYVFITKTIFQSISY